MKIFKATRPLHINGITCCWVASGVQLFNNVAATGASFALPPLQDFSYPRSTRK